VGARADEGGGGRADSSAHRPRRPRGRGAARGHPGDDLLEEIRQRASGGERVLVTTLTKRMAEDLTEYTPRWGFKGPLPPRDIDAIERMEIIREPAQGRLRRADRINLLREGLDIPEVSLVAILDADKEGFLRSWVSLIQTIGRASRNLKGKVLMYPTLAPTLSRGPSPRRTGAGSCRPPTTRSTGSPRAASERTSTSWPPSPRQTTSPFRWPPRGRTSTSPKTR